MDRKPAEKFQDLLVWQKAHSLVLAVYRLTSGYPKSEMFGLTSQMRKAAVSVPANIAEGFKRLILSTDLGYTACAAETSSSEEVARMLSAYSRTILSSS